MTYARDVGVATRSYDMEARSSGDGRTLEGYVAIFNTRTRIPDRNGDFEELIMPGFADRSLRENGYPIMQWDHGKDARVGSVPIGVYEAFDRDAKGYAVRGRLFDNAVVEPVRQAIAGGAVKGMSFRFSVSKGGDKWERRGTGMDLRQVSDADVPEAGPVVFPAYVATTVAVRSLLAEADLLDLVDEIRVRTGRAIDLTDLTGQTSRSTGRGDKDAEPREGDASRKAINRARELEALRPPVTLPRRNS